MKKLMTIGGIVLGGALLWLAIKDVDLDEIAASFRNAKAVLAVPLLLGAAGFYCLKASRWSDLLSPIARIRPARLVPSMMAGAASNNLLPAHAGELVRVYLLGRESRLPKAGLLATLVAERIFDIIGVLLLLSCALLFVDVSAVVQPLVLVLLILAVGGSVLIGLMVRHPGWLPRVVSAHAGRLPRVIGTKAGILAVHITHGFGALKEGRLFRRILLNSILQWLLMSVCIYAAFRAFAIEASYPAAVVVLGFVVAGLALPTSPGFIGTIQYCFVLGLAPFGVDPARALAASIFYHTLLWVPVTATGLYFMRRYSLTMGEIRELERRDAQAARSGASDGS
jgi:uncharacterized protein (TIRG00374 family)